MNFRARFGEGSVKEQATKDGIPTLWVEEPLAKDVLRYLKNEVHDPYRMLYDLTAIDERDT